MRTRIFAGLALAGGLLLWPLAAHARVDVNVNIGPPPIVLAAPPPLVVVPGSPVYYAPGVSVNLFSYRGRYYSFHEGAWFLAPSHRGPWRVVAVGAVPPPVLAVPVTYYRVPPGHGPGGPCPPGHAKHGRC